MPPEYGHYAGDPDPYAAPAGEESRLGGKDAATIAGVVQKRQDRSHEGARVSFLSLLLLAIPSMLLSGAAPLAITVQTALLGKKSTELLAAWAVVAATTNSAVVIFNFLVVGVTAKVSLAVGAKAWRTVGARVRLAFTCAFVVGVVAGGVLFALRGPVLYLMKANPTALKPAQQYYLLRVLGMPSQLLAMAACGVLQGYKRVYLVAAINILRLSLDVAGSYVALFPLDWGMYGVGVSNVFAATMVFLVGLVCIAWLPPMEAHGRIRIIPRKWQCWTGPWHRTQSHELTEGLIPVTIPGHGRAPAPFLLPLRVSLLGGDEKVAMRTTGEAEEYDDGEEEEPEHLGGTWDFLYDGLSTVMRSTLIQITFFMSLVAASHLGVHVTAAHQVVMQLWLVTVYVVDGFANAGTIVGSDLAGQMQQAKNPREAAVILRALSVMTNRLLGMGLMIGFFVSVVYAIFRDDIIAIFTPDPVNVYFLREVWPLLIIVQPLNALVFIYDGLIFAAQSFSYMADCMLVGFIIIFLPLWGTSYFHWKTIQAIWAAKAAFNCVRLVAAAARIHLHWLRPSWRKSWDQIPGPYSCCLPEFIGGPVHGEADHLEVQAGTDGYDEAHRDTDGYVDEGGGGGVGPPLTSEGDPARTEPGDAPPAVEVAQGARQSVSHGGHETTLVLGSPGSCR